MKVLIAVFMGLACGFAIQKIIALDSLYIMFLYAVIYGTTIIRFFEGNVIFYGKEHIIECSDKNDRSTKSKIDIYSTLFQFLIFSAMGHLIGNFILFLYMFIFLNLVDFIWHGWSYLKMKDENIETSRTSLFWSLSNLFFGLLLIFIHICFYVPNNLDTIDFLTIFAIFSVIAMFVDYFFNKDFYFSSDAKKIFENY